MQSQADILIMYNHQVARVKSAQAAQLDAIKKGNKDNARIFNDVIIEARAKAEMLKWVLHFNV